MNLADARAVETTGFTVLGTHSPADGDPRAELSRRELWAGDVLLLEGRADDFTHVPHGLVLLEDVSAHHAR